MVSWLTIRRSGRIPPPRRLLTVAAVLTLLSSMATFLNTESLKVGSVSIIWLPNALLIGILLCAPRRQWPAYVAVGYTVDYIVNVSTGTSVPTSAFFSVCNMFEVLLAAWLLRSSIAPAPDLTDGRQMRRFLLFGCLIAPVATSMLESAFLWAHDGLPFLSSIRSWAAADMLGIATLTPLYLSYHHKQRFTNRHWSEVAALFLLLLAAVVVTFRFAAMPLLWLDLLVLLLLGMRLGLTASAAGLLMMTFVGGFYTIRPGAVKWNTQDNLNAHILFFQLFVAVAMLALYVIEVASSSKQRILRSLAESEARFRTLAVASRDVVMLTALDGRREYVSPASKEVLGWEPKDLVGHTLLEIAHPDDAPEILQMLDDGRAGLPVASTAYRVRRPEGQYSWVECNLRLLRDPETGEPVGLVQNLRDITARKAIEEQLRKALETVEVQALQDGLTGVANRRLLDRVLQQEWQRACRARETLSLLLIDVDRFKAYNDGYGHLQGDACLQQVAVALKSAMRRSSDLVARYGGEEFAVVLPHISAAEAAVVAETVRQTVESCNLPHAGDTSGHVTVSIGVASIVPSSAPTAEALIHAADEALYRAKSDGRNRVCVAGKTSFSAYEGREWNESAIF